MGAATYSRWEETDDVPPGHRAALAALISLPPGQEPWAPSLISRNSAHAVRARQYGSSSCSTRERQAVLLVGGDKGGKWKTWYDRGIREAETRYEAYLDGILTAPPFREIETAMTTTQRPPTHRRDARTGLSPNAVWTPGRVEAENDAWTEAVDYNAVETERFRYSLLGGLALRLQGCMGLDERDNSDCNDYMLSTLRSIVENMGGRLEVTAVFAGIRLEADVSGEGPLWHRDDVDDQLLKRLEDNDYV